MSEQKRLDRPELEKEIHDRIVTLAVGIAIIVGKLKPEDLEETDKNRFEEICQTISEQLLALYPEQKRLDRPALREKISRVLDELLFSGDGSLDSPYELTECLDKLLALYPEPLSRPKLEKDLLGIELVGRIRQGHLYLSKADMPKLLALIPDMEEANNLIRKLFKDFAVEKGKAIEVAKREEGKRITKRLEEIDEIASDHNDFVIRACELIVELREALKGE